MNTLSIRSTHSPVYTLDKILKDTPESHPEQIIDVDELYQSYKETLNQELITTNREEIGFHAGFCLKSGHAGKRLLYKIVKSSVDNPENSIAAANAITILKVMKISFSCLDLRRVQIPGADLSNAILDGADISGANLENVNLINASLNRTVMFNTKLTRINLGQNPPFRHDQQIISIILSPDGKRLCVQDISPFSNISIWDIASQQKICTIFKRLILSKSSASFTKDGNFFLDSTAKGKIVSWKIPEATYRSKKLIETKPAKNTVFAISPSGDFLLTYSTDKINSEFAIHKIKIETNEKNKSKILHSLETTQTKKIDRIVDQIYFSPNNVFFVSVDNFINGRITLWKFLNCTEIAHLDGFKKDSLIHIQFSHDSEYVYVSQGASIYLWKVYDKNDEQWTPKNNEKICIFSGDTIIRSLALIPNSPYLLFLCKNIFHFMNVTTGIVVLFKGPEEKKLSQVECSSDGKQIFCVVDSEIQVWRVADIINSSLSSETDEILALGFSSDVHQVVAIDNHRKIKKYNIQYDSLIVHAEIQKPELSQINLQHSLLDLMPQYFFKDNAKYMVLQYHVHNLKYYLLLFKIKKRIELLSLTQHPVRSVFTKDLDINEPFAFAFCDTCNYFASVCDSKIKIYQIFPSEKCVAFISASNLSNKPSSITRLYLPENFENNRYLVVVLKTVFKVYQLNSESSDREISKKSILKHKLEIDSDKIVKIQFAENDRKLIIACTTRLIILDIQTDQSHQPQIYNVHSSCADISRDGALFVSCVENKDALTNTKIKTLALLDLKNNKFLDRIKVSPTINNLSLSSDNKYVSAYGQNGSLYIWQIFNNKFRLIKNSSQQLQAYDLDTYNLQDISDGTRNILISAGAEKKYEPENRISLLD